MKRPECKMSMENRAKQFLSFAALGSLEDALREKEEGSRHTAGEDFAKAISEKGKIYSFIDDMQLH